MKLGRRERKRGLKMGDPGKTVRNLTQLGRQAEIETLENALDFFFGWREKKRDKKESLDLCISWAQ